MQAKEPTAEEIKNNSIGWMLKSISVRLDRDMNARLAPLGLNLGQFAIVMTLLQEDGITQAAIGKKIGMPGYATTRNIDVLERMGVLTRERHATSRRSFSICLTPTGKAWMPDLFSVVKDVNAEAVRSLTEKEIVSIKKILSKMIIT